MKEQIIFFLLLKCCYFGNSLGDRIHIGLIADRNYEILDKVFSKAIEDVNINLENQLAPVTKEIDFGNSLQAYNTICEILPFGIGSIFGPSHFYSSKHLLNLCDEKEIPFIEIYDNIKPTAFNLYPDKASIADALHDIIDAYEWPSFTLLYESGDYLGIVTELIQLYAEGGPVMNIRKYDLQINANYRSILRKIRKSEDNCILIIGSSESIYTVLKQSQEVGIMTEAYKFIIGNLDFQSIDLESFRYSEANITGIRMFSPESPLVKELTSYLFEDDELQGNVSCPITMEMALLYDGVMLFAETSKNIDFSPVQLNCGDSVWDKGSSYKNYLGMATVMDGITGNIFFENGIRIDYSFDIIELVSSGLTKVGTWSKADKVSVHRYTPGLTFLGDEMSLVNKTFTVLLSKIEPFGMLKQSTTKLSGNNRYEGFAVELIQRLAERLGFNYTFVMHKDDVYGAYDTKTNTSTGMIREIMIGNADLGVTDLTITAEREAGVDFTIPFMNLGISILYKKAQKEPPKLFSFMDPFANDVWLLLGISYLLVSTSLFILGRFSAKEWDNPFPCNEEPDELENQFTFGNALWFTIGALLQQGSEVAPKASSTRTVASAWWFFQLIIVASYTANLAAFLTVEQTSSPINNVWELAENKGGVQYGAKQSGSTRNFFAKAEFATYNKMNEYMTKHPELLVSQNGDGVQKVLTENYAFLMESTSIEYQLARLCNLTQIGGLLDEKGYGIAMRKDWPYRSKFNEAIIDFQESGVLTKMKNKWWNEVGTSGCSSKSEDSGVAGLGMDNLGGVYFVLLVGSVVATIYGFIDWLYNVYRRSKRYHVSFKEQLKEDFRVVMNFSANTRPSMDLISMYSRNNSPDGS
ncbi:GRIK3 family protein [Megaselia abdita]